jgi:hypothetical protein
MFKEISGEDLKQKDLPQEFLDCFEYNTDSKELTVKGCIVDSNFKLYKLRNYFIKGQESFTKVIFYTCYIKKVRFDDIEEVMFVKCSGNGLLSLNLNRIEIVSCDFSKVRVEAKAGVLTARISDSTLLYFRTYAQRDEETNDVVFHLQSLAIQNKSQIKEIQGLHNLLRPGSTTIVLFSLDSHIESNPEWNYRSLLAVAKKMNDSIQADILYSKLLSIHRKHADSDGKILLFFEWLTNRYGQSFLFPVLLMLLINGVFIMFLQMRHILPFEGFWNFWVSAANINPLHALFDSKKLNVTNTLVGLDSIRRLALAALAYQTVSAARRYSPNKK